MLSRLALLAVCAFLGALSSVATAEAAVVTETSGDVSATLLGPDVGELGSTSLEVARGGARSTFGGLEGDEGTWTPGGRPITILDLDADGEPEVVADLYSGGAHCCQRSLLVWWDGGAGTHRMVVHDWGESDWMLDDLDVDGRPEFVSSDGRWAYWGASFGGSGFPLRVLSFRERTLRDVTREFPLELERDMELQWIRHLREVRRGTSPRGYLAAYMADAYLLGVSASAWRDVYAAYRAPDRTRFFGALRRKLLDTGYRSVDDVPPPVPSARQPRTVVGCGPAGSAGIVPRIRPRHCVIHGLGTGDAGYWSIRNITWTRWTPRVATGRGTAVGRQFETNRVIRTPVRLTLAVPRSGCAGRRWFSLARISTPQGRVGLSVTTCSG